MTMKKVYFVRHGQSEGNSGLIWQSGSSPLSEKGKKQAEYISERVSKLPIDIVVSSTMKRAEETTKEILKKTDKEVMYSDLFVERRRPKEMIGKLKKSPESIKIEKETIKNFSIPGYRFSDEENFDDLKKRAQDILKYLSEREEENILVVTHGFILRIIMAVAVFGDSLTGEECDRFIATFHTENTGISVLGYDMEHKKYPWWVWVWNDHAHLSELE